MSLFSFEEICKDCTLAIWHNCEDCYAIDKIDKIKFCHCDGHLEEEVNHYYRFGCVYKILKRKDK